MCGSRGLSPTGSVRHDRHCRGTGNNQWNFRIRTQRLSHSRDFVWAAVAFIAHLVLIMDGVIGKVEQDSLPGQQIEKLTLPLFVLSFFSIRQ